MHWAMVALSVVSRGLVPRGTRSSTLGMILGAACLLFGGTMIGHFASRTQTQGQSAHRSRRAAVTERPLTVTVTKPSSGAQTLPNVGGAVYIRWGRRECPANSTIVYSGVIGSGNSGYSGGVSDYLCMTDEPEYGVTPGTSNAHIFGAEFKMADQLFRRTNSKVDSLEDQDATCVVCQSYRSSVVMIPGRRSCVGAGWMMEYRGYLMSGKHDEQSNKPALCVDQAPAVDTKGAGASGGALLWPVVGMCGALPCPGYSNGRELACVVCTR